MSRETKIVLLFQFVLTIFLAMLIVVTRQKVVEYPNEVEPAIAVSTPEQVATPSASAKITLPTPTPVVNPVGSL